MNPQGRALAVALSALALSLACSQMPASHATARVATSLPAFPGAEGFGTATPGGRGGAVLEVTSTADAGPGTLRVALEAAGPRMVVFRTGGLIRLDSAIEVRHAFLTVAGQTAPGDGIAIKGAPIAVRTHDVVLRYLRVRPGAGRPLRAAAAKAALTRSGAGTPPADSDADGMPDGFETAEGLNPADPGDGPGDADGDEFLNGTEP